MNELKQMNPAEQAYVSKFHELMQNVEEHATEEEQQMFPDARTQLGDDLMRLGEQMEQRKQQAMTSMQMA